MKKFDFDRAEVIFQVTCSFLGMLTMHGPGLRKPITISADEISLEVHGVDTSCTCYDIATRTLGFRSDDHIKYHLKEWKIRMTCARYSAKLRKAATATRQFLTTPITATGERAWYYTK
jgi:hypothetical protein